MNTKTDLSFVKAFLFDLDGTLLDTLQDLADAMNRVLAARRLPVHRVEEYRYFVGDGMREMARRVYPGNDPAEEVVDELVEHMRIEYGKGCYETTRPYEGIVEMLQLISETGIPMAVFSNKPHQFTVEMVEYYFGHVPLGAVTGVGESVPRKPDPAGALMISRQLEVKPEHFLYLGDTATDMRTATRAAMYGAGAAWGFRDEKELRDNGAKMILGSPRELTMMIQETINTG